MSICTLRKLRTLRPGDAHRLLQCEHANRRWFEAHIDPRGDAFYTRAGVHDHIAAYLDADACATWHPCVIVGPDEAIVGRAGVAVDGHQFSCTLSDLG
ncbi:MAG: hypothetical protein M3Y65_07175 [Pseudomonadota bacterium]|nr:hypothetical protein [Pseudomonadota bacterium]